MEDVVDTNVDNFKEVFKYYKRKKPSPDYRDVLQINDLFQGGSKIMPRPLTNEEEEEALALGLISSSSWKIFNLHSHPDLLFIRNPFSALGQLKWIQSCLMEYPRNPNKTNFDSHGISLSDLSWWELANSDSGRSSDLIKKLRWVTLGYHHNWDTKEYSESMRGVMPQDLKRLCSLVAKVLDHDEFHAEAAIINFYHEDSSLGPHTDHSEPNMKAPLLSFSFGQSAVFLIGGTTKETKPTALYLHSGDILIMTESSRLAYHAVPRIVFVEDSPWKERCQDNCNCSENCKYDQKNTLTSRGDVVECDNDKLIHNYAKFNRINMNIRQVLLPSLGSLS